MWQAVIAISSEETCLGLRLSCPLWANLPALQEDPSSVLPKHHLPQPATSPLTKAVSAKPELACGRDAACYMKEESNLAHYTKVDLLDNRILKCHTMVYLKLLSSLMYVFFFFLLRCSVSFNSFTSNFPSCLGICFCCTVSPTAGPFVHHWLWYQRPVRPLKQLLHVLI